MLSPSGRCMIKAISFNKTVLKVLLENNLHKEIDLGATIWDVLYINECIIVLLRSKELSGTENHNRNIICLNEEGKIVWRVANPDLQSLSKSRTPYAFTGISLKGEDKIEAFKSDCYLVDIDIKTGKFIGEWTFTK